MFNPFELFRTWIYDTFIPSFTAGLYREVLLRLPNKTSVLDIGIGTGTALVRNEGLLREREISWMGVDLDADYVRKCERLIAKHDLTHLVRVVPQSIYDFAPGESFDCAYFSDSFMLLPDQVSADLGRF
eukprot:TRINITY_DN17760_c0_g1_i1.p1 TRINITY_DN17760_c0_g1~~TRINITY_DN17760_c0_g1_i1.p1  ORF type:complete len:129 (-),score=30.74 TRINITY_DN17760_c0_g1_i1:36-422(-)